jgi:hypothetical protein
MRVVGLIPHHLWYVLDCSCGFAPGVGDSCCRASRATTEGLRFQWAGHT